MVSTKHREQCSDKLSFSKRIVLNDINLVWVLGMEWRRVVLENSSIQHPLYTRDRVAGDLAPEGGVHARSAHHHGAVDLHLGLAGKVLGLHRRPGLGTVPLWLRTLGLTSFDQQILLDH